LNSPATVEPVVDIAVDADRAAILELLQDSFGSVQRSSSTSRNQDFWKWKYQASSFGPAFVQVIRIEGQVAAAGCLWPFTLRWNEHLLQALQPCDTAVHPAFRRRGLFTQLNIARKALAVERGVDLLFNFPNRNSLPGYLHSGWQFVGKVPWLVRVMKPIAVVRDHFRPGKSTPIEIPHTFRLSMEVAKSLRSECVDTPDRLSIERAPGFWEWRFCKHPTRQYGLIQAGSNSKDFALFTLSVKSSGLIEMIVVDLVVDPARVSDLLVVILNSARSLGAGFVAMMRPQAFALAPFIRRGFLPLREKNLAILPVAPDLPVELSDIGFWDFRAAMHDSI